MATLSDYMSGTISLANGSVTVTGTGTLFEVTRFREGDTLQIQNLTAVIASVDSDTQLTLTEPWTGTTIVDGPYRARQLGDGSRVSTQAATVIELLGNGVLMNLAELGVEEGKVPVGGPTGEYELADPATFGIQDPNGSLGKLAALTLAARQILQTDETGALTALTLAARQILQTDANGAITPVSLTANKTLRTDANADIVLANVEKPLLASYGGADINGLSQIVFDIPNYYVGAEVEIRSIRSASASGSVGFRCGPAGGTLVTDYRIRNWNQYGTGDLTWSMTPSRDLAEISPISTSLANLTTATIQFGTGTSGWCCLLRSAGWDPGAGFYKTDRAAWSNANGIMRRLAIVSTVPLGSNSETSIRIYGVR